MLDTDRSYEKKGVCEQSNLGSVPKNLITGKFTYISHFKRVEKILQSWEKMQRLSNSNVFPAIAVFAPGCVDNNLMIRASCLEKGKALGTRLAWSSLPIFDQVLVGDKIFFKQIVKVYLFSNSCCCKRLLAKHKLQNRNIIIFLFGT